VTATQLKPRSATEIVDASFRLLRQSYVQLAAVTAVVLLPYIVLVALLGVDMLHPGRVFGLSMVLIICAVLAEGAIVVAVSESYLEGTARVSDALATAARRLPGLIGALILRGVVIGVGMVALLVVPAVAFALLLGKNSGVLIGLLVLLCIAPLIYLILRTLFVTAVLMLEKTGAMNSVSRSWSLAGGQMWRVLLTMLLAWVIYGAVFTILSLGVNLVLARNPTVSAVVGAIIMCFAYPFLGVVTTLLYYDLRVRKEGFDLEIMTEQLAATS